MHDIQEGDWKIRIKAYENILQLMANPTEELLNTLYSELPRYLADENPSCQRTALLICDKYFKVSQKIDYVRIATVLIEHGLTQRQQIVDSTVNILIQCLKESREEVTELLFDDILDQSPQIILAVVSIVVAHLATLTSRDAEEAEYLIEKLRPLKSYSDSQIAKEVSAAIAAAKFVCDADMDTINSTIPTDPASVPAKETKQKKEDDKRWIQMISSSNWKDRKVGYEDLLESISEDSNLAVIEHNFLIPAGTEKNVICEGVIAQILIKLAETFKTQMSRKLREYITPVMNMLMQKRQAKLQIQQSAFDALALNVVSSPYESPFVEHLLKMMQSQSARLKEEAIAFIARCPVTLVSQQVIDAVQALSSDQSASIRDAALKLTKKLVGEQAGSPKAQNEAEDRSKSKVKRAMSPDVRRSAKRRPTQSAKVAWENWVDPEVLKLLTSGQWTSVTKGLEDLQAQFNEDPSNPSAVIMGLSTLFTGKTFTPKVMQNLMNHMLTYLKYAPEKVTDDALSSVIAFAMDKIQDKRLEQPIFDILDSVAECNSAQFVFQAMYPHVVAKNPVIPLKVMTYFAYHLREYGTDAGLNIEDFAIHVKPAFSHSDIAVRKAVNECHQIIASFNSAAANEYFSFVKVKAPEPAKEEPKPARAKGKSEIPISGRKVCQSPRQEKPKIQQEERGLFPARVVQSIAKMQSILDTRRALDEVESILNRQIDQVGEYSVSSSEFTELFIRLRQWFKESNTNIVLSVTKVLTLCFRAIIKDQIMSVSSEFLCDVCLLLNFVHKGIRSAAIAALTQLDSIHPSFVSDILLPMFGKFNVEGKRAGVHLLKNLEFEMNVEQFCPLIAYFLADKSEPFRESARPIIEKFLQIQGASDAVKATADQYPPAQKSQILSRLQALEKQITPQQVVIHEQEDVVEDAAIFKAIPTKAERRARENDFDPHLPLRVLNCEEQPGVLQAILEDYSDMYFQQSITASDDYSIRKSCSMLLSLASSDFDHFVLILDIVMLWWANQALLVKQQEGFNEIIQFLDTLIGILNKKKHQISRFEFTIILPTILECYGRDEGQWESTLTSVMDLSDKQELLDVLVELLTLASSVYTIVAIFKTLVKFIIPVCDITSSVPSLVESTERIQELISKDEQHEELYEVTTNFMEILKAFVDNMDLDEEEEPKPVSPVREPPKKVSPVKEDIVVARSTSPKAEESPKRPISPRKVNDVPKQPLSPGELQSPTQASVSKYKFTENFAEQIEDPSVQIYSWISDIWSNDPHIAMKALKKLSAQMKEDPTVLTKHSDAIIVSLIAKLHALFTAETVQTRTCKYTAFCLLNMFNETDMTRNIKKEYVQQLIYEVLTHVTNGIGEAVLNQEMNAIIIKLLEECPMQSFIALLSAAGEYSNYEQFSEKWMRMVVKCLEPCGARICEIGNITDIRAAVELVREFYEEHPREEILASPLGAKIVAVLDGFSSLAEEKFGVV